MYSLTLRLDWSELDHFGHINNVQYYKFIQSARVNFWNQIGLYQDYKNTNIGPILANACCDFLKPLYYPGNVRIDSEVAFIKSKSFGLRYKMYNDENELVAEGQDVMVYFDFNQHISLPIPEWLREQLLPHLTES